MCLNSTASHKTLANAMAISTAAEPKSFANPDSECNSVPILSTVASIAVLTTSANKTNSSEDANIAFSMRGMDHIQSKGTAIIASSNSCLNADSFLISHINALSEFFKAMLILSIPLGLFLKLKCCLGVSCRSDSFMLCIRVRYPFEVGKPCY